MKHISKIQFDNKKPRLINVFLLVLGIVILTGSIHFIVLSLNQQKSLLHQIEVAKKQRLNVVKASPEPALNDSQKEIYKKITHYFEYPWLEFFIALEKANQQQVALLSIEPDLQSSQLKLSAEAVDIHSMFVYIEALKTQTNIESVALINQYRSVETDHSKVTFELDLKIRKK